MTEFNGGSIGKKGSGSVDSHLRAVSAYLVKYETRLASDVTIELARHLQLGSIDSRANLPEARSAWLRAIRQGACSRDKSIAYLNICAIDHARCLAASDIESQQDLLFCTARDIPVTEIETLGIASVATMMGEMAQHIAENIDPQKTPKSREQKRSYYADAMFYYDIASKLPDRRGDYAPSRAICSIGDLYAHGDGVGRNAHHAVALWHKAAASGLARAMMRIAEAHYSGKGTDVSLVEAEHYLAQALYRPEDQGGLTRFETEHAEGLFESMVDANTPPYVYPGAYSIVPRATGLQP